jgi:hypothetical protein
MFLFQDENKLTRENDQSRHSHTHFTAPSSHVQIGKKRVKEKENNDKDERQSLNQIVWSIKRTQGDSRMIRGSKKKPPARLTKKKKIAFFLHE